MSRSTGKRSAARSSSSTPRSTTAASGPSSGRPRWRTTGTRSPRIRRRAGPISGIPRSTPASVACVDIRSTRSSGADGRRRSPTRSTRCCAHRRRGPRVRQAGRDQGRHHLVGGGGPGAPLLASGEVVMTNAWNGRISAANRDDGRNFKLVWPGASTRSTAGSRARRTRMRRSSSSLASQPSIRASCPRRSPMASPTSAPPRRSIRICCAICRPLRQSQGSARTRHRVLGRERGAVDRTVHRVGGGASPRLEVIAARAALTADAVRERAALRRAAAERATAQGTGGAAGRAPVPVPAGVLPHADRRHARAQRRQSRAAHGHAPDRGADRAGTARACPDEQIFASFAAECARRMRPACSRSRRGWPTICRAFAVCCWRPGASCRRSPVVSWRETWSGSIRAGRDRHVGNDPTRRGFLGAALPSGRARPPAGLAGQIVRAPPEQAIYVDILVRTFWIASWSWHLCCSAIRSPTSWRPCRPGSATCF